MSTIDERLKTLRIVLPDVIPPGVDGYVPAFAPLIRSGDRIYISGRLGKVGVGIARLSTAGASGSRK